MYMCPLYTRYGIAILFTSVLVLSVQLSREGARVKHESLELFAITVEGGPRN